MSQSESKPNWARSIHEVLTEFEVRQVAYLPDAGHGELIKLTTADPTMKSVPLTTEEEGVALLAGSWLGGERAVLLMQPSGVGNCLNMFSLVKACRFPFLSLVAMRGEWGEFNPWQVAMGAATQRAFELMDIQVYRTDLPAEVKETITAAAQAAFLGGTGAAVLLSQRLIGTKVFVK
jgi:sulfopyruvate decarboxylase alpha subunit